MTELNKHLPQLDGLRGIAILIVLIGHVLVFHFGLGITFLGPLPPIGVDLFFVLSGFLITRILLESRHQVHYFRNFYARRALRIWPLYFVALAVIFTVTNHRIAQLTFDQNRVHWPVFVVYVQNLTYRQASQMGPLALAVTWSLAVEEQFYTIWPMLVRWLSVRGLTLTLLIIVAIAPLARFIVPRFGFEPYINPLCRFDAMAIGGLIAIWIFVRKPAKNLILMTSGFVMLSAVVFQIISYFAGVTHYVSKTILSAAFGAALLAVMESRVLTRLVSSHWLRYTGKVSYCLYLCHLIVAGIAVEIVPGISPVIRGARSVLIVVASYAFAAISWKLFEEPILKLKKYFSTLPNRTPDNPKPSGSAGSTSVKVAVGSSRLQQISMS